MCAVGCGCGNFLTLEARVSAWSYCGTGDRVVFWSGAGALLLNNINLRAGAIFS